MANKGEIKSAQREEKALLGRINATITKRQLINSEEAPFILMVSGGSDSVALAYLAPILFKNKSNLTILHINHQLRGEDSDKDERYVSILAKKLNIEYTSRSCDITAFAAQKTNTKNIEQAGRTYRYEEANKLLDALCDKTAIDPKKGRIITAHTLDDRAETFFMRSIVGAGTGALASIPYSNGRIIRPLLDCTRAELQQWLINTANAAGTTKTESSNELWREDATNADRDYLRAFVRHEVIPQLKQKNPELLHTLQATMENLALDEDFLTATAAQKMQAYVYVDEIPPSPVVTINAALFNEHRAIIRRLVREACQLVAPFGTRLDFEHIEQIAREGNRVGFATDVAGDVTVRNVYGTLVIRRKSLGEQPRSHF